MTITPDQLAHAHPDRFVGEYAMSAPDGEGPVPVLDVFEGELPDAERERLAEAGIHIYEFMPLQGDELDVEGAPYATAALQPVEGDSAGVRLVLAVAEPNAAAHNTTRNPVIEGRSRFQNLFKVIGRRDGFDHLYVDPEQTHLTGDELQALGFQAVAGDGDTLRLDLDEQQAQPASAA